MSQKRPFIVIVIWFSLFGACHRSSQEGSGLDTRALSIKTASKTVTLTVEVADSAVERAQGLMNRESLDDNRGMLFIFDNEDIHSFWMKNTPLSLDIIWISAGKEIVSIEENTTPYSEDSIVPGEKALYVLEVNAGFVSKNGVNVGDRVGF